MHGVTIAAISNNTRTPTAAPMPPGLGSTSNPNTRLNAANTPTVMELQKTWVLRTSAAISGVQRVRPADKSLLSVIDFSPGRRVTGRFAKRLGVAANGDQLTT